MASSTSTSYHQISKDDTIAAVFSKLIYEAHHSSGVPGHSSSERLTRVLHDRKVQALVGKSWVVRHSTQDFALFVNPETKQAIFACRGSLESRDWLASNFLGGAGLYDGRLKTMRNSRAMKDAVRLQEQGFTLSFTGHSLGGSLASALAGVMKCAVTTFNAPELSHKHNKYNKGREWLADHNMERHYRLSGDATSTLNFTDDTRPFHQRGENAITLPFKGSSGIVGPHGMNLMAAIITGGSFDGVYSTDVYGGFQEKGRDIDANVRVNDDRKHELSLGKIDVYDLEARVTVHRNLFFEIESSELIVRDKNGNIISRSAVDTMHASKHMEAALGVVKDSLKAQAVDWLSVGSKGLVPAKKMAIETAKAGVVAFASSVTGDAIRPLVGDKLADGLGAVSVSSAFQAMQGDHKAAIRTLYEYAVSSIIQQSLNLPLSFGSTTYAAIGQIFGSRCLSAQVEREHLSLSLEGIAVGIHLDHTMETISLRDGRTLVRETDSFGVHGGKPGMVDVALGIHSGFESTSAKTSTTSAGLTTTEYWDRSFKNELRLSLDFGKRHGSWRILPALSSHKRTYKLERYEDGRDLYTRTGSSREKHKLAEVVAGVPEETASPSSQPPNPQSLAPASGGPSQKTVQAHNQVAEAVIGDLPADGWIEHVTDRTTIHHEKKKFLHKTKRWDDIIEGGWREDRKSATSAGTLSADDELPAEIYTEATTTTSMSTFQNTNGARTAETFQGTSETTLKLLSRADGKEYSKFASDVTTADGRVVKNKEQEMHHLLLSERDRDSQGHLQREANTKFAIGTTATEEMSVATARHSRRHHETEQEFVAREGTYKDKVEETKDGATTTYGRGEKRVAAGVEVLTKVNTTADAHGLFAVRKTVAVSSERNYTQDTTDGSASKELQYSGTPSVTTKTSLVQPGWLADKTVTTTVKDGKLQKTEESLRLNQGADRALGIVVTEGLDKAIDLWTRHRKGDASVTKADVAEAMGMLCVNAGEGYIVGLSGQLAACTKELGDAVPYAFMTIVAAWLARKGIAWLCQKPKSDEDKRIEEREARIQPSAFTQNVIMLAGDMARCSLQLIVVGMEIGCSSSVMFGLSQAITSFQKVAVAVNKEGLSLSTLGKSLKSILPEIMIAGAGSTASMIALAIGKSFLASSSGLLATSLMTIVMPALAFWGMSKICLWMWRRAAGTEAERELVELLARYELRKDAEARETKRRWHDLSRKLHPDKPTGNKDKFQLLQRDFERIFALQEMIVCEKMGRKALAVPENQSKSIFRRLFSSLAKFFRSRDITEKEMEERIFEIENIVKED